MNHTVSNPVTPKKQISSGVPNRKGSVGGSKTKNDGSLVLELAMDIMKSPALPNDAHHLIWTSNIYGGSFVSLISKSHPNGPQLSKHPFYKRDVLKQEKGAGGSGETVIETIDGNLLPKMTIQPNNV